jgi:hypothetical protein
MQAAAPAQSGRRRRTTAAKPTGSNRGSPSLGDQILTLATGKTQQEIAAACKGVRANHVGMAIARHKRAGRIEERDGRLYATQSSGTEQHAVACIGPLRKELGTGSIGRCCAKRS